MADNTTTGKQLFFDLIAASAEPRPRSSFEAAAWAVAAEHAKVQEASAPSERPSNDADLSGPSDAAYFEPLVTTPHHESTGATPDPPGLRLVDDGAEPPLHPIGDSTLSIATLPPGPRVSAFAAATGAALAPISQRSASERPPVAAPSGPHPAQDVPADDVADQDPRAAVEAHAEAQPSAPGVGGAVPGLNTWVRSPLLATDPTEAPGPAEQVRISHAVTTDQDHIAPADRPLETGPIGSSSEPAAATQTGGPALAGTRTDLEPRLALLDDDDDFGPLVLPEPTRRGWRRTGRGDSAETGEVPVAGGRGHSRRTTGLILAAIALLACAAVWWLRPAPTVAPATQPPDVAMVEWRGIALPTSATAGPTDLTDTRAAGFAPTALGAAIAAAQLSVRTDPAAGPEVFEPVLADQVVGDEQRLADAVREQFNAGPTDGAPGTLLGWRVDGDPASGSVTAHLAVEHADGTRADYAIPLAWVDGDWRIDALDSGPFFPITDLIGKYTPFVEEAIS
jgi:hypothetical protein